MPQNEVWREDFWRMTLEHNVKLIVMLNAVEERKEHHQPYYPNELNHPIHYGRMQIIKKGSFCSLFYFVLFFCLLIYFCFFFFLS
jgi:protein tyrosine phosphatase